VLACWRCSGVKVSVFLILKLEFIRRPEL
jgi:hypothetical protein